MQDDGRACCSGNKVIMHGAEQAKGKYMGVSMVSMKERELLCEEKCKFQREGRCMLERLDFLAPVHGAVCCDHLWEEEAQVHD